LISTPRGTKMFQFPRFPPHSYGFRVGCKGITPCALPHSDIPGSVPAGGSPRLIAAYHVLHRLLAPRHPPCALTCATPAPSRARHTPDLALYTHSVLVKVPDQQTGRSQAFVSPKQRSNRAVSRPSRSTDPSDRPTGLCGCSRYEASGELRLRAGDHKAGRASRRPAHSLDLGAPIRDAFQPAARCRVPSRLAPTGGACPLYPIRKPVTRVGVEPGGVEPPTSAVQRRRSPN
jgi:hypothetical protein